MVRMILLALQARAILLGTTLDRLNRDLSKNASVHYTLLWIAVAIFFFFNLFKKCFIALKVRLMQ